MKKILLGILYSIGFVWGLMMLAVSTDGCTGPLAYYDTRWYCRNSEYPFIGLILSLDILVSVIAYFVLKKVKSEKLKLLIHFDTLAYFFMLKYFLIFHFIINIR